MKILITGATGLLGSEICRQLARKDLYSIRCMIRRDDLPLLNGVEVVKGDILDVPALLDALDDIDIVIHAAAMVSFSKKEKQKLFETNLDGTANVVNACVAKKIKKLVYVSSVAAIGKPEKVLDALQAIRINENFKWIDSPINSAYAQSKYLAELEVWRGQAEGLKTVIINPTAILGEGEWQKSSTQLFNYIYKENKFLTAGYINYIDVKDVAAILIQLMESDIDGERYIVSAGKISLEDFFSMVAKHFNKRKPMLTLGKWAIAVLWRLEAIRGFLTGANPLITKETAISARTNVFFENDKIKDTLGYEFIDIDTSVKRVCAYLLAKE